VGPRILDLYCGMGGLSLGFASGVEEAEITGLDIDGDAVATYNLNLRRLGCRAYRVDVLSWEPRGEFDLVIGGPPCQPFSRMNTVRRGEDHPLFPTFSRFFDVVLRLEPEAFVLENVPTLVSTYREVFMREVGKTTATYNVAWRVLDAASFGVPQRRRRVFAIGIRKDVGMPSFPRPTHGRGTWVTVGEAIGDLRERGEEAWRIDGIWIRKHRPLYPDMPAPTVVSHVGKNVGRPELTVREGEGLRRVTVRECLRLQSFPDWWSFPPIGTTKRYTLVGEAVPPVLAYKLAVMVMRTLGYEPKIRVELWDLPYRERAFTEPREGLLGYIVGGLGDGT